MRQAFARDWATRIDEFTDQLKIDLAYGQDLQMLTVLQAKAAEDTMEHLNKLRAKLDEWQDEIKNTEAKGVVPALIAKEVSEIASQAIATAAFQTGCAMGLESKLNADNPTVEQLAEQLSTDLDFMKALAKTTKFQGILDEVAYEGTKYWLDQYAIWKDGEQYIGCMNRNLKDVLVDVKEYYGLTD